jgi:hypothetical protein
MSGFLILAAVLFVLMVAYQIYVSRRVARSHIYSNDQRIIQLIMIWLLPMIGASICHWMISDVEAKDSGELQTDDGSSRQEDKEHEGPGNNDSGE